MRRLLLLLAAATAVLFLFFVAGPSPALAKTYGDRLVDEGDQYFRLGNYYRASEAYRCAVLEEPADGRKKLAFGHSLYAQGNYTYAAYMFRRGIRYLGFPDEFSVELTGMFPTPTAFDRSLREVRRYLQFYPKDPHAFTVMAYVGYFGGSWAEAERACRRLLETDERDLFAAYILRRIELEVPEDERRRPHRSEGETDVEAMKGPPPQAQAQAPEEPPAPVPAPAPFEPPAITTASPPPAPAPAPAPAPVAKAPPAASAKPPVGTADPLGRSDPASTLSKEDPEPAIAK